MTTTVESYCEVDAGKIPHNSKVITSHVIYKLKTIEARLHSRKAQIFPHRNKYYRKD